MVQLYAFTKKDSYIYGMTDAYLGMVYVQKGSIRVYITNEEGREIMAIHSRIVQKLMDSNIYVRCFVYELATKRFSDVVWVLQEILFAKFDVRMARFLLSIYKNDGINY